MGKNISNPEIINVSASEAAQVAKNPSEIADSIILEAAAQPTEEEKRRQEVYNNLLKLRITTQSVVEPEKPAISIDGIGAFAIDDIHGIKAKQKSGKTTALKVIVSALLKGSMFRIKSELDDPVIAWLDTEQKEADVKLIIDDLKSITNLDDKYIDEHLFLFHLRKESYEVLLEDLKSILEFVQPNVAVIDGVVDFIADFNNLEYSMSLIQELMLLSAENHCSIINVLHTNKAPEDRNMRGHLGTMLAQKSGTVLECEKNEAGVITIKCADSRHAPLPTWSLKYSDGCIVDADEEYAEAMRIKQKDKEKKKAEEKAAEDSRRRNAVMDTLHANGEYISRSELTKLVMEKLTKGETVVKELISSMVNDGVIYSIGKNISTSPQAELFNK